MRSCEIPCLNGWMNQTSTSARGIIPGRCGTRIRKGWEAADRPGRILVQAPCLAARAPNTGGRQEKRSNSSRNCRRGLWLLPGSGRGRPGSLGACSLNRAHSERSLQNSQNPAGGALTRYLSHVDLRLSRNGAARAADGGADCGIHIPPLRHRLPARSHPLHPKRSFVTRALVRALGCGGRPTPAPPAQKTRFSLHPPCILLQRAEAGPFHELARPR